MTNESLIGLGVRIVAGFGMWDSKREPYVVHALWG